MKKYLVGIREVHVNTVEVLAESEDDAKQKAKVAAAEDNSLGIEYSYTMDKDCWRVEESTDETD